MSDDLASSESFRSFNSWWTSSGGYAPKCQFPAVFTPPDGSFKLNGVLCTEEIKPNEVICYVPNKILLSTEKARNSEIAEIFRAHKEMFVEHADRDFYVILLYVLFEKSKGQESDWYTYFETSQVVYVPGAWDDDKIEKFACQELVMRIKIYKEAMNKEWLQLQNIIKSYTPKFFPEGLEVPIHEDFGLYMWATSFVASRYFGWGIPC